MDVGSPFQSLSFDFLDDVTGIVNRLQLGICSYSVGVCVVDVAIDFPENLRLSAFKLRR